MSLTTPVSIVVPFGVGAGSDFIQNPIPFDSQISVNPGRASYTDGFTPANMTPKVEGGIPPYGQDMNGVLYAVTATAAWVQGGMYFSFQTDFVDKVGGYPFGAILVSNSDPGLFFWSTTADNVTDPDGSPGTDWISFRPLSNPSKLLAHVASGVETINDAPILGSTGFYDIDTTAGAVDITGLTARYDGQIVTVSNTGTGGNLLTLDRLNSGSIASNQFRIVADLSLTDGDSLTVRFSAEIGKWVKY